MTRGSSAAPCASAGHPQQPHLPRPRLLLLQRDPETRSELVAPVASASASGALNVEEARLDAFDADERPPAGDGGRPGRQRCARPSSTPSSSGPTSEPPRRWPRPWRPRTPTPRHATSTPGWADAVGRRLGLEAPALRTLRYGAIFHQIGKIAVPEAILNKPGRAEPDEWAIVKRHTVVGEQILAPAEFLSSVLPIVRHEHEAWDDGTGYPDGLCGMSIPLGSRIVLACDACHAMTSDRPYRPALDRHAARQELSEHAGTQFDPLVVDALLDGEDAQPALAVAGD